MLSSLQDILLDPITRQPLRLFARTVRDGQVVEGELQTTTGVAYPIIGGIPRFVVTQDAGQKQTEESFGYKWQQEGSYQSPDAMNFYRQWVIQKYGFADLSALQSYFYGRQRILDAGCGSGFTTSTWLDEQWRRDSQAEWVGVDISNAIDIAYRRFAVLPNTHFVQADIFQLPFKPDSFDTIFSEGVLHHTPSTQQALNALVPLLREGGEILFYVYREKGPIREFTDDYLRSVIADMAPEEAWKLLEPLTSLGEALAALKTEIEVRHDIPYLGIKAGRYDLQRFIYWHFAKLFWNEEYTFEQNHHVNFDWYHPHYAHRQTEAEVRQWCTEAGLSIVYFNAQESGFTVRALKR